MKRSNKKTTSQNRTGDNDDGEEKKSSASKSTSDAGSILKPLLTKGGRNWERWNTGNIKLVES